MAIRRPWWLASLLPCLVAGCGELSVNRPDGGKPPPAGEVSTGTLQARVVAVGIPGAGAVRQVGPFLEASPIGVNAPFAVYAKPGEVLAPDRVLVASDANFGAPKARSSEAAGAILSIDVKRPELLVVPAGFAEAGNQSSALDRGVRLYAAQTGNFLNSVYHADAITAAHPSVSLPTGISINNAFGRPWFSNAPGGFGTISVTDPDGRPLAAVVSRNAGGIFAGTSTNRAAQIIAGSLSSEALGTAFLGPSPDGSRRAVFASVNADGSLAQVHVEAGVDGLAPAGTLQPMAAPLERAGVAFNWIPSKSLYVANPLADEVVLVKLTQDASVFRVAAVERLRSSYFKRPVDVAPALIERASLEFSSGSTLAGGSDLYVANRGDGTLARITQAGQVIAVRRIDVAGSGLLQAGQLNGVATSTDGQRLFLTVTAPHPTHAGAPGMLLEVSAFDHDTP